MSSTAQPPPVARLASAFSALCDFLAEPSCRQCEVLRICLTHLQEDASEYHPACPSGVLRSLRRAVPFSCVRRRFNCRRCVPAEILAAYLTPGEETQLYGTVDLPALSWTEGEWDLHW